jgi:hypothetical protein
VTYSKRLDRKNMGKTFRVSYISILPRVRSGATERTVVLPPTGVTGGPGTAYPSGAHEFTPGL